MAARVRQGLEVLPAIHWHPHPHERRVGVARFVLLGLFFLALAESRLLRNYDLHPYMRGVMLLIEFTNLAQIDLALHTSITSTDDILARVVTNSTFEAWMCDVSSVP